MSDNIKVVVKVRPLISREIEEKLNYQWRVQNNTLYQIDQSGRDCGPSFTFDKVYDKDTKTSDVYNDIAKPIVEAATAGFNGTIFAYGQTSSGKTYTMTGTEESPGIIPLAVLNLFDIIKNIPDRDFLIRVSYVEIYNETLTDLLSADKKVVKIQETLQGLRVDATEKVTTSPDEVLETMLQGKANRQTASTNMNDESSRSHSIFQITIESREHIEGEEEVGSVHVSQLNLVDLAGSERAGQTGATGLRFKEGTHINKSLSALALVIKQLSEDQNKHVNYRDSKLTRILQNSLGGNAKTSIICAVTPASVEETISTLQFANRAKAIKNTPAVNAVATNTSMIQNLTKQLCMLKTALENKKNVEQDNCNLQKQIANLQKLIINGFHQRSSTDLITGARRKLHQPRRITISTLHPIQEDTVPSNIPKFCTPSLKYNPLHIPSSSDFTPISETGALSILQETPRLVTPPLADKKVNFTEEIINLDSDDETTSDVPCSPYHGCYEKSKTPPCVLRKHAKQAEKNLKELIELTEREKQYSPTVGDLAARCKDFETKLTDCEVSYETLLKKYQSREKELLSLLEEQNSWKSSNANGTMGSPNQTMMLHEDTTKRKNENSENELMLKNLSNTVSELQTQITFKEQTILELQAVVTAQKHKIDTIENVNEELNEMLTNYKQNVLILENENVNFVSKVKKLSSIIESQKTEIMSASADVDSYNSVIQELQIKLADQVCSKKKTMENSDIETMIANEEMFIASNENMKNLIQTLKSALDSKTEELNKLKLENSNHNISNDKTYKDDLSMLQEEIVRLKNKLSYNEKVIDDLKEEKAKFSSTERELLDKLTEVKSYQDNLQKLNLESEMELQTLKDLYKKLSSEGLAAKEKFQTRENELNIEIESMSQRISTLENDIKIKDQLITSLNAEDNKSQENFYIAKQSLNKIQDIIILLTGNIQEVPDIIDNFVGAFKILSEKLALLERIIKDSLEEKKNLQVSLEDCESEISKLKRTLDNAFESLDEITSDFGGFVATDTNEDSTYDLQSKIKSFINKMKVMQQNLIQNLEEKKLVISKITSELNSKELELNTKTTELSSVSKEMVEVIKERENLLNIIGSQLHKIISEFSIVPCEFNNDSYESEIINFMIDNISNYMKTIILENNEKINNVDIILAQAKKEISELTDQNHKLSGDISQVEFEKNALIKEIETIQDVKQRLVNDLTHSNTILSDLKEEIKSKVSEIEIIENRARDWKEQFLNIDSSMKRQVSELEFENANLREELDRKTSKFYLNNSYLNGSNKEKSVNDIELISPPSLLTICCNKIVEAIQPSESDECISAHSSQMCNSDVQSDYKYNQLQSDIEILQFENTKLKQKIENLEIYNNHLITEQEEARNEIRLLLESAYELQKKVITHRTNLCTLTATTYAENKSLSSQLKFLQLYHSLFDKACQKEIPEFKKQLQDLMIILKSDYTQHPNDSLRRCSLPNALENSMIQTSLKYESLLDGDLLMLDTNITLTTCDNTLTGHDQTCFDVTQSCNEVGCQTNNANDLQVPYIDLNAKQKLVESLESLKVENDKLRTMVDDYQLNKPSPVDSQNSPFNSPNKVYNKLSCDKCVKFEEKLKSQMVTLNEINLLEEKLTELKAQKDELEAKYNNLKLEIPTTDALVVKLRNLEKDHSLKTTEIDKLKMTLSKKNEDMKNLQEENDSLSNQIMEIIDEGDNLRKEIDYLKQINTELTNKISELEILGTESDKQREMCPQCLQKDETISSLQSKLVVDPHKRLSRSYSDSDSSSQYNKICTLQSELHAGREDCNELKNEVTNIKNHLERSNISIDQAMDLDESIGNSQSFTCNKECNNDSLFDKSNMPDIPEERPSDLYSLDRIDCVNYCAEKIGADKENFNCDTKIIDIMTMLYDNLINKHNNEIENLVNKLRDFEESKNSLQTKLNEITTIQKKFINELEEKDMYLQTMANVVSQIKNNLSFINSSTKDSDILETIDYFKDNFFTVIDKEFGLASIEVFQTILLQLKEKYNLDLNKILDENKSLQDQSTKISEEFKQVSSQFSLLKNQLLDKENDYNLLTKQKEKMYEISNAVTLNIVKKEDELRTLVKNVYEKLLNKKIIHAEVIDMNLPASEILPILFDFILQKDINTSNKDQMENLMLEIEELKSLLEEKNKQLHSIKEEYEKFKDIHNDKSKLIEDKDNQIKHLGSIHESLKDIYDKKLEENEANLVIISKLTDEVKILKENIERKETAIQALEAQSQTEKQMRDSPNDNALLEMTKKVQKYTEELENLRSANKILLREKESSSIELDKANNTIKKNKLEMEKMMSDVLILKESVDQNSNVLENLRLESKTLLEQNALLKQQIQEKTKECSRLEINIKTHQKTAEIQTKMIIRLQKEKAEVESADTEHKKQLEEMSLKLIEIQQNMEQNKAYVEEIESLKNIRQSLEERVSELEVEIQNKVQSYTEAGESSRSRRQSLYDSMRIFSDNSEDQRKIEAVFKSRKCDELFMDVDDSSSRSTPVRLSKGRESLASRHEQSEEEGSRASSVQASRRRRQSIHDAHRSVSALETSRRPSVDRNNESSGSDTSSEISKLRKQVAAYREELEDLREKYNDLDQECETCAEYLRERDEQCRRLVREKRELESAILELKQQIQKSNPNAALKNASVDAAVNTDKDWANLHSVVVDRMSYDAEVEKNKKLTKCIEELRYTKQELKNTLGKMQKAIDKHAHKDKEIEVLKSELEHCNTELSSLRERCRELDEECDTCAEYLKERDEQCHRLKEAKAMLENENLELRQKIHSASNKTTARMDTAVNTDEDSAKLHSAVLSYEAEVDKNKKLMKLVEELRHKKQELKMTITKMQKTIDKNTHTAKELEATKSELERCNKELSDVRERCRELEEECDTCAEYLKEREEQCHRLKEAKASLEMKLLEYQESSLCMSVRKKRRQTLHDQNRRPEADRVDVATETSDDFLSYQVERDETSKKSDDRHAEELKRLRIALERLSRQKASLEQRLAVASAAAPLYVATGSAIVQNQQFADVMKENQRLKKINAKLVHICKKGKPNNTNQENEDPADDNN
ncbi:centromere-associated protein E-like isoform X2 [Zerene cesonia]|uniref:centromere-associated protein E-like isoform X2 n=1 Tax=Zerene cesonia TaxID=33412 RepID=UPI0018E505C1|nr:centromere-associated protein E-like isoform X2 [Zerene cesonia]